MEVLLFWMLDKLNFFHIDNVNEEIGQRVELLQEFIWLKNFVGMLLLILILISSDQLLIFYLFNEFLFWFSDFIC